MTSGTTSDTVLSAERDHLLRARDELRRMRESTRALLDDQATWGNDELTTRALAVTLARRHDQLLDDGVTPLFFGRLDYRRPPETFHVGRRHVTGADGEPVVVDWRAPICEPFYRATAAEPAGVALRRRFGYRDGTLTAFEDDRLDRPPTTSALLVDEIERPRSGPMRDIVATIQPDQDALVRAPLGQTLCVQGAPGTGKTAVGLHRAAYLLYAHRQQLRAGVLVVGPSTTFLSYVQEVLPALGEVLVTQRTAGELSPTVRVRGLDDEDTAVLKGDARWAAVLARALWRHAVRATEPLVLASGARRWRVWPDDVRSLERLVRGRDLPWTAAREALAGALASALVRQMDEAGVAQSGRPVERLAASRTVTSYVDALWPRLTAQVVLARLLSDPEQLADAGRGLLSDDEQRQVLWAAVPATAARARWSSADLPLLDEAAHLIDRVGQYPHVVLDEAQDLSPMQLRAVGRRCAAGSVTVLGDLAQGTTPWAATDWNQVLEHLGKPAGQVRVLTTGYRVPRAVLDYANRLLPTIAPQLPAPTSLRDVPDALTVLSTPDVASTAASAALARDGHGSVAVVAAAGTALAAVADELARRGATSRPVGGAGDPAAVVLVPVELVKGLEFDHVVVLEPAVIAAAGRHGLRLLYVALTRAVSSLTVVHADGLPPELGTA